MSRVNSFYLDRDHPNGAVRFANRTTAFAYLWLMPIFLVFFMAAVVAGQRKDELMGELGLVEILTDFFLFVSILICGVGIVRTRRALRYWCVFWLGLCVLLLLEETNFLQIYLKYETPEYFSTHNVQDEVSLHNLTYFTRDDHGFGYIVNAQNAFRVGFITYFLVIPISMYLRPTRLLQKLFDSVRLPIAVGLAIWVPIGISIIPALLDDQIRRDLSEVREMCYAYAINLHLLSLLVGGLFTRQSPQNSAPD